MHVHAHINVIMAGKSPGSFAVLRLCDFIYEKHVLDFKQDIALTRLSNLTILCL